MKQTIETQAATVEAAVDRALEALGLERSEVEVEVLREAEAGAFLGIGRKDAIVRVTAIELPAPETTPAITVSEPEPVEGNMVVDSSDPFTAETSDDEIYPDFSQASEDSVATWFEYLGNEDKSTTEVARLFLEAVLELMGLKEDLTLKVWEDDENLYVEIDGEECGILIGRRGATLNSLQYLLILMTHRHGPSTKFVQLDIGGYHRRRKEGLVDLAKKTAERALSTGNAYELNPMRAPDRRIVHEALADFAGIITYSEGQGRDRFVVIDLEDYDDVSFE